MKYWVLHKWKYPMTIDCVTSKRFKIQKEIQRSPWPKSILFYTAPAAYSNCWKHWQIGVKFSMYYSKLWMNIAVWCEKWPKKSSKYVAKVATFFITRQIWGIWKLRPAYSPETPNLGQNRWCFVLCDLEIWWMTLENNRASLLCCFKLCAHFIAIGEFKLELQSGNAQFGSNSKIFRAV